MRKEVNKQTCENDDVNGNKEKEYYIELPVTSEVIEDFQIDPKEVKRVRRGGKNIKVVLVKATKEVYETYYRSDWREAKRIQRHKDDSYDRRTENGVEVHSALKAERDYNDVESDDRIDSIIKNGLEDETERVIISLYFKEKYTEAEIAKMINKSQKYVNIHKTKALKKIKVYIISQSDKI